MYKSRDYPQLVSGFKTTIKSEKARKIIRKAERDLLQARVKSINNFLDNNNNKQPDRYRSQLASIVTTKTLEECQNLINKLREFRHLKIRDRQIIKFNGLVEKQEEGEERVTNSDRSVGSACNPHPGQGPSPGNSAATSSG